MDWVVPNIDPCTLITKDEAEALIGQLQKSPRAGGTAIDGTACAYVAATAPVVITIGMISINAFEMQKFDLGNETISNIGDEAYLTTPNAFEDVYLFARKGDRAVLVKVTVGDWDREKVERYRVAKIFAEKAVERSFAIKMTENARSQNSVSALNLNLRHFGEICYELWERNNCVT